MQQIEVQLLFIHFLIFLQFIQQIFIKDVSFMKQQQVTQIYLVNHWFVQRG